MTINGEPVCEIDIRASYLTIYHSWFGQELDLTRDPYVLSGLGMEARDVVKLWFVATFGSDGHLTRWPTEIVAEYRDKTGGRKLGKDYPLKVVREKAIEAFPVLAKCGQERNGWAKLMWEESVAMFFTMRDLMTKHSIPSLSVHDSIIVPFSSRAIAEQTLSNRYQWVTRVKAKIGFQAVSLGQKRAGAKR